METEKKGPSDGSDYYQKGDDNDDELNPEEKKKEEGLEKDVAYNEELKELEEVGRQMKERKEEDLKRFREKDIDAKKQIREEEKIMIGGQEVKPKKIYSHNEGKRGIFIRGKSKNYQTKIRKAFKKIHGVSLDKKRVFEEIIGECAEKKIVVSEKEIDNIVAKFKHKTFTGSGSSGIKKMLKNKEKEGIDIKKYKKELQKRFTRGDLDKFKRAIKGGEDPRKHRISPSLNRNPGAGRPGSTSPSRIKNR